MATRKKNKPRKDAIDEESLEKAKEMYMQNTPVAAIARHLDLARTSLQYHVDRDWRLERESLHMEEFTDYMSTRQSDVTYVTKNSLSVMKRGLKYLNERSTPPTIDEVLKAGKAIEILAKIAPKKSEGDTFLEKFEQSGELQTQPKKKEGDIKDVEYIDEFE